MFPGTAFLFSVLTELSLPDPEGRSEFTPGAKALTRLLLRLLKQELKGDFLSLSGRLCRGKGREDGACLELCCVMESAGLVQLCQVRHRPRPASVGAWPWGFRYRWTWNQSCSHRVGRQSTSVKPRPCEPSACTVGWASISSTRWVPLCPVPGQEAPAKASSITKSSFCPCTVLLRRKSLSVHFGRHRVLVGKQSFISYSRSRGRIPEAS